MKGKSSRFANNSKKGGRHLENGVTTSLSVVNSDKGTTSDKGTEVIKCG